MKKIKLALLGIAMLVGFSGCTPSSVDAGEEAVLIYKPYIFGHGGVDSEPVTTGLTWTALSTSVERVTLLPFNIDEVFDDLVTEDNNPVDFKIHLTFKHIKSKTPILIEKFGKLKWYKNKVREPLRNSVRSFTKNNKMFDMTTNSNTTTRLQEIVESEVRAFLRKEDIPTELMKATIGKVMPPQAVIDATIQTAVQKQNVKTQDERVKAEKARKAAEQASAEADSAYMIKMKMTPSQYLSMKQLENQRIAIDKGSQVTIIMGNATPMVSIK